jgi:hypothetical protein
METSTKKNLGAHQFLWQGKLVIVPRGSRVLFDLDGPMNNSWSKQERDIWRVQQGAKWEGCLCRLQPPQDGRMESSTLPMWNPSYAKSQNYPNNVWTETNYESCPRSRPTVQQAETEDARKTWPAHSSPHHYIQSSYFAPEKMWSLYKD